ncbi:hypothetical protein FYK55_17005 [Roseiconus nitratireducens]|uniref:Toprim domain-containing protein n=1 Tax=Roseiconus nitratireducens TaxID=2605748 RepID=A0A5M6D9M5_9BACT|nr:hypothetical protein [Roseiconus nitratireducens]KAA5541895.1 hypothetical protein FYK55_17005 [Roseiconus nitratireducens]
MDAANNASPDDSIETEGSRSATDPSQCDANPRRREVMASFEEIKRSSADRCGEIIAALTPLPADVVSKAASDHPCPVCDGKTVIWPDERNGGANHHGRIACRNCTDNKPTGDIIATVAAFNEVRQGEAAKRISQYLGLSPQEGGKPPELDIIEAVAKDKRMPIEAFRQFNPKPATRGRDRTPVARVGVYNEAGEIHSYFDFAPGNKGWFQRGKGMSGLFLPGRLPQSGECWLLVEGGKDASAGISLGYHACGLPTNKMDPKYAALFRGVDVIVVPDLDKAGWKGASATVGNLLGIASSVKVARLPGTIVESGGDDLRDALRRHGEDAVKQAIETAEPCRLENGMGSPNDRPEVVVTLAEAEVAAETVEHLGKLGWSSPWVPEQDREAAKLYTRGGLLVHTVPNEDPESTGEFVIRPLPICLTRERITLCCQLVTERQVKDRVEVSPMRPPKWLIDAVHNRGWYDGHIKPLAGIVQAPTIRTDGSILQKPGYDETTGIYYQPKGEFPEVPDQPTREDAVAAINDLFDVVVDFPFVDGADRSAWLCMLLSMVGRPCVRGCVPCFVFTANIRGSGKSLLVDCGSLIAYGRSAARHAFTRDDDEARKLITSVALEAAPSVLFDNLDVQLGGAALDAALTSEKWQGRVLGSSRTTGELPLKTIWCATGNNMAFGSDVARRVLPIRLQSPLEAPEERTGFEHTDLLGWIAKNRPRLAVSALTILRAYFVAGCPDQPGGSWGSFESWSRIIRGAVVWAGADDPLATREAATANDDSRGLLAMLITGLEEADPDNAGLRTQDIERLVSHRTDETSPCPTLVEAVREVCGERFNSRKFGRQMRKLVGRIWEGRKITDETGSGKVRLWRVSHEGFRGFQGFRTPILHAERVVSHIDPCDTQHSAQEPGETNPQNPRNPRPHSKCPKCSGELVPADLVIGEFRNWDCSSPSCDGVVPVREVSSTDRAIDQRSNAQPSFLSNQG